MKIVKSLDKSGLLIKGVSETIKNEAKEQKKVISQYVIRNIRCQLLGNLLTGKGVMRAGEGVIATSQGRGRIRAGQDC